MSLAACLWIILGLALWVAVAWAMLAGVSAKSQELDWRDQLVFAFWPVMIPTMFLHDLALHIWRRWRRQP